MHTNSFCFHLMLWLDNLLKSRPSENCLADFCTSALLKDLKSNQQFLPRWPSMQNCRSPLGNLHMVSNHILSWRKKFFFFIGQYIQQYNSLSDIWLYTPPNSEIICGQNVGTKVVCGMILYFEKKAMLNI